MDNNGASLSAIVRAVHGSRFFSHSGKDGHGEKKTACKPKIRIASGFRMLPDPETVRRLNGQIARLEGVLDTLFRVHVMTAKASVNSAFRVEKVLLAHSRT